MRAEEYLWMQVLIQSNLGQPPPFSRCRRLHLGSCPLDLRTPSRGLYLSAQGQRVSV